MISTVAKQSQFDFFTTPADLSGQVFERRSCPVHYWSAGDQHPTAAACLHGALMDHRMFNAQAPLLAEKYRVLVWDGRGHGRSQPVGIERPSIVDYVSDLEAMLDHAGVERMVLIGQSLGAYVAQHFTRLHPERVLALVLIGSTPVHFAMNPFELWALKASVGLFRLWPYRSLKPMMANNTTVKEEVARYALDAMNQVDLATFISIWSAVSTAVRRDGYPDFRIEVPFLLTHGDTDRTGTIRRDGPRWAASDPEIEYYVIPQAGHNANQDNPVYFNQVLADFLGRRVPPGL
jgi:3-oxoadipate enol-lactonase